LYCGDTKAAKTAPVAGDSKPNTVGTQVGKARGGKRGEEKKNQLGFHTFKGLREVVKVNKWKRQNGRSGAREEGGGKGGLN